MGPSITTAPGPHNKPAALGPPHFVHGHIFLVPVSHSGKECVCPFTYEHFLAPEFGTLASRLGLRGTRTHTQANTHSGRAHTQTSTHSDKHTLRQAHTQANTHSGKRTLRAAHTFSPSLAHCRVHTRGADPSEEGKPLGDWEEVDLSHHTDRVSVQCSGNRANSTGPEASLASASLREWPHRDLRLDDGQEHTARILLERNRFRDPRLARVDGTPPADDGASDSPEPANGTSIQGSSYRLLVYIDDMHRALINLEIELRDLFDDGDVWDGQMTAGFTAGTGKVAAGHSIHSWSMHEICREQDKERGEGWNLGKLFQ